MCVCGLGERSGCKDSSPITLYLWITLFWKYTCDVFALGYTEIFLHLNKTVADKKGPTVRSCPTLCPILPHRWGTFGHLTSTDIFTSPYSAFKVNSIICGNNEPHIWTQQWQYLCFSGPEQLPRKWRLKKKCLNHTHLSLYINIINQ